MLSTRIAQVPITEQAMGVDWTLELVGPGEMPRFDESREGLHLDRTRRNPLAGLALRAPISCRGTDMAVRAVNFNFSLPHRMLFSSSSSGDARARIHGVAAGERGSVRVGCGSQEGGGECFRTKTQTGSRGLGVGIFFVSFLRGFFPGPWRSVSLPATRLFSLLASYRLTG